MQTGNMIVVSIIQVAALACAYYIGKSAGRQTVAEHPAPPAGWVLSLPKTLVTGKVEDIDGKYLVDLTLVPTPFVDVCDPAPPRSRV